MAGNKYWVNQFPRNPDGTETSITAETAENAAKYLGNATAGDWKDNGIQASHALLRTNTAEMTTNDWEDLSGLTTPLNNISMLGPAGIDSSLGAKSLVSLGHSFWLGYKSEAMTNVSNAAATGPMGGGILNPFSNSGFSIFIKNMILKITTASTPASKTMDVGLADDSSWTNIGTEFFDGIDLTSAATHIDIGDNAANGSVIREWTASGADSYLAFKPMEAGATAGPTDCQIEVYIECFVPELLGKGMSSVNSKANNNQFVTDYSL
tara:strand:+ start:2534 stop:3331 length:798 start_codon:yes stop_codon:yes gene_type:complete